MDRQIAPFPTPKTGKLSLVVAPKTVVPSLMAMLAALALSGEVIVVDGGNCFDGYALARAVRRRTHHVQTALKAIKLSRAFTCYQMVAMLAELPLEGTPIIVLDMMSTFLDENVSFAKRQRLLGQSLALLRRISQSAPVAVWSRNRSTPNDEAQRLLTPLLEAAHEIWELETPKLPEHQLPLF
jgi:energy-converting hydrogenase Eha subunit H